MNLNLLRIKILHFFLKIIGLQKYSVFLRYAKVETKSLEIKFFIYLKSMHFNTTLPFFLGIRLIKAL